MDEKKQIEELIKILMKSNAISYEPNARPLYRESLKKTFYVSDNDGRLTIDYSILAKDVYEAGWHKKEDIEITRCKDCRYCEKMEGLLGGECLYCAYWEKDTDADTFCSEGY